MSKYKCNNCNKSFAAEDAHLGLSIGWHACPYCHDTDIEPVTETNKPRFNSEYAQLEAYRRRVKDED